MNSTHEQALPPATIKILFRHNSLSQYKKKNKDNYFFYELLKRKSTPIYFCSFYPKIDFVYIFRFNNLVKCLINKSSSTSSPIKFLFCKDIAYCLF